MDPLRPKETQYPKAMFRKAEEGEGDIKSPAYERIVMEGGEAKRKVEFHPYVSVVVNSAAEEKALGSSYVDHPEDLKLSPKEAKQQAADDAAEAKQDAADQKKLDAKK